MHSWSMDWHKTNKNVDIKFSAHVSGITFTRYAQKVAELSLYLFGILNHFQWEIQGQKRGMG